MNDPITPAAGNPVDITALLNRVLTVGATLTDRLLDLPADSPRNPATDYAKLTRGIRQSILLLERLAAAQPAAEAPTDADARRTDARKLILRSVEDVIQRRASDRDPYALRAELIERLAAEDFIRELDRRPTDVLIAELCRDLGLDPISPKSYVRRTPDDIAVLNAVAADPASAPTLSPEPPPPAPPREPPPKPPGQPPRRAPLSTPSLILPPGAERQEPPGAERQEAPGAERQPPSTARPEAHLRDHR